MNGILWIRRSNFACGRPGRHELRRNASKASRSLPHKSSFSSMEQALRREAIARMEQYVNNSDVLKLDIDEVEECSLGPEYSDVDVKLFFF